MALGSGHSSFSSRKLWTRKTVSKLHNVQCSYSVKTKGWQTMSFCTKRHCSFCIFVSSCCWTSQYFFPVQFYTYFAHNWKMWTTLHFSDRQWFLPLDSRVHMCIGFYHPLGKETQLQTFWHEVLLQAQGTIQPPLEKKMFSWGKRRHFPDNFFWSDIGFFGPDQTNVQCTNKARTFHKRECYVVKKKDGCLGHKQCEK